jgi:hypothetical protein
MAAGLREEPRDPARCVIELAERFQRVARIHDRWAGPSG